MNFSSRMFGDVEGIIVFVVQLAQLYLTLCNPMDCSMPGFLSYTSPRVCANSCSLSQRCHPAISSSMSLSFSRPQSFTASGSFPMSWLFASGGQSTAASASASHSNECSGLTSCRIDWFDIFAVQGTLKSLLQHHS